MQSKLQIEQMLLTAGIKPNKRFGQHFLIDLNLMRLLIGTAEIEKNDVVLEVGCATGSLTEAISEKAGFCVTVEIDPAIAEIAKKQLQNYANVEIIVADVLKNKFEINPDVINALNLARSKHKGRLLLIANLPYAAATPLMLNFVTGPITADSTSSPQADAMFVTVQKEVADRMLAHQGSKDYGILSILLAAAGKVKHIRTLKPTVFWPQPQVNSALVSFIRDEEKVKKAKSIEMLSVVASGLLQHRRKMLKVGCKLTTGTLEGIDWLGIFAKCDIDPNNRPDQLSPEQFVSIANLCAES